VTSKTARPWTAAVTGLRNDAQFRSKTLGSNNNVEKRLQNRFSVITGLAIGDRIPGAHAESAAGVLSKNTNDGR
jgi:hypothetical protein